MFATLMADRKSHPLGDLYSLRRALLAEPMSNWLSVINRAHPLIKVRLMHQLRGKYDSLLTRYFLGCKSEHYFDQVCWDLVDLNKLDTTFMALCYHLIQLTHLDKFDAEKRQLFRVAMVTEFTLRTYHFEPLPVKRRPEDAVIKYIASNDFVLWKLRTTSHPSANYSDPGLVLEKDRLIKLLYAPDLNGDPERNVEAVGFLLNMAMRQPGKLLNFLQ